MVAQDRGHLIDRDGRAPANWPSRLCPPPEARRTGSGGRFRVSLPDHVFINECVPTGALEVFGQGAEADRSGETTLRFVSSEPKLELLSIWRAQTGPGPVEHHFEIVNRSGQAIEVPLQPSLALTLTRSGRTILSKTGGWKKAAAGLRMPARIANRSRAGYQFEGRYDALGETPEMIPWMSIQDATGNAGVYFGIEFSGRVGFDVSRRRTTVEGDHRGRVGSFGTRLSQPPGRWRTLRDADGVCRLLSRRCG